MTPRPRRRVTAGLDGGPLDRAVLDHAAAACRVRRLPLQVLHAEPWLLGDAFRHVRACWPGVPVTARLVAGGVGDALAGSDLLVVGGNRAGLKPGPCPVVVVDH